MPQKRTTSSLVARFAPIGVTGTDGVSNQTASRKPDHAPGRLLAPDRSVDALAAGRIGRLPRRFHLSRCQDCSVEPSDVTRAVEAAISIAATVDLPADDATVLHNSNKLALRLAPCDVLARVAHVGQEVAQFEVDLAQRLAEAGCPVGTLDPRVDPLVHLDDGFAVTLWTYYEPVTPEVSPADYADALERLHVGMRRLDVASPSFTDRVAEAEELVASVDLTPELADADRELLSSALGSLRRSIGGRGFREQLLHGEPHPGNVLSTKEGPLFIDLETCCRGPVEFDLAHVPEAVSQHYPGLDHVLLNDCRQLVLAMVAAWRWDRGDQFPNGKRARQQFVSALRDGPPWPTLDVMVRRHAGL